MRDLLEQSILHHLNGEEEKAVSLFRQFLIGRSRQIHESMRNGNDPLMEEGVISEEYFEEEDLGALEGDEEELEDDQADDLDDMEADEADEEEAEEDFDADEEDLDNDFGDEEEEEEEEDLGEEDLTDRLEELEAELKELSAKFEELEGGEEGGEGDDMDDFDRLEENVELYSVGGAGYGANAKGEKLVGAGEKFKPNNTSVLPRDAATNVSRRADKAGEDFHTKQSEHNGFEREAVKKNYQGTQSVKRLGKARNVRNSFEDEMSKVKDAGYVPGNKVDGKPAGAKEGVKVGGNKVSPIGSKKLK